MSNQRRLLKKAVTVGFSLIGLAFIVILVLSLGGYQPPVTPFANIPKGQTEKQWHQGQRVWVTRLNKAQKNQLGANNPCIDGELCIVSATTQREGIEIVFARTKPLQIESNDPWLGGYIDPTNGNVYDLGGVAIYPKNGTQLELLGL